jgi:hypothetical protein
MADSGPRRCPEQQRLIEAVQVHLIQIAELSRATAEAVAGPSENLVAELDTGDRG